MPSDVTTKTDSSKTAGTVRFRDGIGVRVASADAFGEPIEQLQLCTDLAALESAVRERVSRLINFRHVRYVRLRGSERLTNATKDVVVTYDAVPGTRLSEFLDLALHAPLRIDIDTALLIVRELLPAIAVLHDSRNVTHGAIAPERLVLTPQGRLVIVDHGLGLALGKLGYSRKRLWQQLRVPVPQGTGKIVFDARTDVIQIGMVALALILGRPIDEADFPQNLEKLLDAAKETPSIGQSRALSNELRAWLDRALPLEKRVAFATVREAQQEFEKLFAGTRYGANSNALKNLVTKYAAVAQGKAPVEDAPAAAASEPIGAPVENPIERGLSSGRRGDAPPPAARHDDHVPAETEVAVTSLADAVGLGPKGRVRAIRKALVTPISELSRESFLPKDVAPNALAPKGPALTAPAAPAVNAPAKDTGSSSTASSIKAKGVDVKAPNAKVAAANGDAKSAGAKSVDLKSADAKGADAKGADAKGADAKSAQKPAAKAPLAADVAAFEEVASDTYTDAQVSIATKGTQAATTAPAAPAAKTPTSDVDAQSILLMDAVDDETPLVPASAFEDAAPDLDRFAGMGARTAAKGSEAKPIANAPEVKAPEAKAPEAKVADVKAAEAKSPAIKAPAAKVPATIKTADLKTADPKAAEPKAPALKVEVKTPDVKTPDVKAPAAKAPEIKAPAVNAPAVIAPAAKAPAANVPATIAPAASGPAITAPAARVPAVNVPAANVPADSPLFSATPAAPVAPAAPIASNVPAAPVAKATPPAVPPAVPVVPAAPVMPAASSPAAPIAAVPAPPSVVPPVAKIPLPGTPIAQPAAPPAAVAPPKVSVPLPSVVLPAVTPVAPAASIATPSETPFVPLPVSKTPAPPVMPVAPPSVASTPVAVPPVLSTPVAAPPVASTPVAPPPVAPPAFASTPVAAPPVASTPVAATPVAPPPAAVTPVVVTPVVAAPVAKAPVVAPPPVAMPNLPEPDLFVEPAPVVVEEPARKKSLASKLWAAVPKPKKAAPPPSIMSVPEEEDFASAPPAIVAPAATQVSSAPAASVQTVAQPAAPVSAKPAAPVAPVAPVAPAAVSPLAPAARVNTPAAPAATPTVPSSSQVVTPPSSAAGTPATPAPDAKSTSFDWNKDVAVTDAVPAWARGRVAGDNERGDNAVVDFDEASGSLSSAVGAAASRAADVAAAANVSAFMAAPKPVVVKAEPAASSPSSSSSSSSASSSDASQRMLLRPGSGFFGADAAAEAEEETEKVVAFKAPRRQMPRIHINWRRTLAASLVVSIMEGVAFATAYWYVIPTETGSLLVETTPAGIEILVDGRVMGRTPFSDSLAPGRHTIELRQGTNSRVLPVEISSGVQTMQRITWSKGLSTGQARVTATAANSHVTIDGKKWGKAPLTISTLAAGKHMVSIESDAGTVSTPIAVSPGETTELDVPIYPGWVSVLAPVQLFIYEGERFLGTTEGEKLMLAPGKHKLDFVSEELGFKRTVEVTITPGATAAVSLPMPKVAVTVEGPEGADLIVDGEAMGKLPLTGLQVPLGTRDFVVRHPDHGEKRQVVTVTSHAPMRVSLLR
jgi:hypothetical protein